MDFAAIDSAITRLGTGRDALIALLQTIQEAYNYLPPEALTYLSQKTGIPEADITGVATFYGQFRLRPAGRHTIKVCVGTACHVKGADRTFEAFQRELGIAPADDTDAAREFTVEKVACLGCCMLAVAVQVDKTIYANVTPTKVPSVLRDIRASLSPDSRTSELPHFRTSSPGAVVRLCACSSCAAAGAADVLREIRRVIHARHLPLLVREVGCTGGSYHAPLMEIAMADGHHFRYGRIRTRDIEPILLEHVRPARLAARLAARLRALAETAFTGGAEEPPLRFPLSVRDQPDACYWTRQQRIATQCAGELPPLDLDDYRARGGFTAYEKCTGGRASPRAATPMPPEQVIAEIEASGLRGRGGGGFPTGRKWRAVAKGGAGISARVDSGGQEFPKRGAYSPPHLAPVIVCNGDEGDPGAFMDRMLLESYPFRVLEGMMIAAHAVGAQEGILYIRHEYPLAVQRIKAAIEMLVAHGVLAVPSQHREDAVRHPLTLRVVEGAGAFVCGEETALLASIEGRRGIPHVRPPYPAERGLHGRPTLVNNVETLALIPWIIREGAENFRAVGTPGSPGTKAFALAGKIERGGLIEVPMGLTLREVVTQIGGIPEGQAFKAVQVGGPSGGCIPAALCDTPVDYEALTHVGGMMGSGGLVVLDATDCMVDIARYFLSFTRLESCGTCTGCRIGTKRMLEILERLCEGKGQPGDLERLERLAQTVREGSICGLGKTATNPVLSTLRHFRDEYEAHARGICPAKKCRALIRYAVTDTCIGCTLCAQACPAEAIAFTPLQRAAIDPALCTTCDICRQLCPAKAIEVLDAQ
ncbi:MAG: NAD(P)H-dependent oxidoreductase subunit E [Kiritimatiellaeota bacterium]|nr:NAD(P)H-dependent oxidoreductase subunit E [Kiritimatiellota bacterium]